MKQFLIIFDKNLHDEFDCQQFEVVEAEDFDKVVKDLQDLIDEGGHYFGTNEGWEEGDVELGDFSIRLLSEVEYGVLRSLFPTRTFGTGIL